MEGKTIVSGRREPWRRVEAGVICWSRRRLLTHGALPLAFTFTLARAFARGPANLDRPQPAPAPDVGASDGATRARTEAKSTGSGAVRYATDSGNRLTTAIHINGRGPFRFLVDTGAERTLIAAEIAAQLGLPRGRKVLVEGIIRDQPEVLVAIESLRMGRLVSPPIQVPILPRAMLQADGYLGLDVLDGRRVILNFTARTITVVKPLGFFSALWTHADEAVVRTLGASGRLRATDCRVEGVRAAAFLDTGAEVSIMNPALYRLLRQRAEKRLVVDGPVGIYGVTGGRVTGLETNIDEIRLGPLTLTYTSLVVAALRVFDVWGLSAQPALLFGMDCLRRFSRVSIDYRRKELRFEVASTQVPPPLQAALSRPMTG